MATWVVTGANRGIGLEICRQLKARGEDVVAACRKRSPELDALGVIVVDGVEMTSDSAATAIDGALGDKSKRIDVLLHNAGVLLPDALEMLDFEAIKKQIDVNALGPLRL